MDYQKKYFTLRRALEKIENIGVEHPAEDTSLRMFRIANYALRDDDDDAVEQKLHPTPESLASSQAVSNASTLEQSDGESNPAQARVKQLGGLVERSRLYV